MPKKYRLTGEELKRLSGAGPMKRLHGSLFSLSYAPIEGNCAKIATVVSKKVARSAVDRNMIKRRSRAALGKVVPTASLPYALVFHAKKGAGEASFVRIREDIESLVAKVLSRPGARS